MTITLSGLGDLDTRDVLDIRGVIKDEKLDIKLYPTYYDWSVEGEKEDVKKFTMAMWGMPEDQWVENCLIADEVVEN